MLRESYNTKLSCPAPLLTMFLIEISKHNESHYLYQSECVLGHHDYYLAGEEIIKRKRKQSTTWSIVLIFKRKILFFRSAHSGEEPLRFSLLLQPYHILLLLIKFYYSLVGLSPLFIVFIHCCPNNSLKIFFSHISIWPSAIISSRRRP